MCSFMKENHQIEQNTPVARLLHQREALTYEELKVDNQFKKPYISSYDRLREYAALNTQQEASNYEEPEYVTRAAPIIYAEPPVPENQLK